MAKSILIFFVLAGILIAPEDLSSCGPFETEHLFSGARGPLNGARYFSGKLDIVQPHYARIYLMAAYRYLSGLGISAQDQAALPAQQPVPEFWNPQPSEPVQQWLRIRVMVGAPPIDRINRFKIGPERVYILNCGDDAFRNAAQTLGARFQAGLPHDDLREWAAAQDQVFTNCASNGPIPDPLPATAALWMRQDRAYQIASAKFYDLQFDAAAADFQSIAQDRASPWHTIAPYLAARAMVRKTTVIDDGLAPAAEDLLHKVLADPNETQWHESARGLLRFLRMRQNPSAAVRELAQALQTQETGVAGLMNDYRLMLDKFDPLPKDLPRQDDITDWIATTQNDADDHAMARWRATHSLAWLVATLTWADKPDPELMAAAAQVPHESPAYLTVQFHRLRMLPAAEARPQLDVLLHGKLDVSARNLFLAERMRGARSWDELLRYAPRAEAGTFDGLAEEADKKTVRYFDDDAAYILDRQAPLSVLSQAARNPSLPASLQLEAARAVWVRAIMMNDTRMARDIAPILSSRAPYLQTYLDEYVSAPEEKTRTFAAAWLLLNNPGMRPAIEAGPGRETPTPQLDHFRDNWWRPENPPGFNLNPPLRLLYQGAKPEAAFSSPAERAEVKHERDVMSAFPPAVTFMARQAVAWAGSHPGDPRVPQALHLAVAAIHYNTGSTYWLNGGDQETNALAKRAFEVLHSRYPDSDAARRTRFWYKAGQ